MSERADVLAGLAVMELDALRELANIGAGHAATALSQMTGRLVLVSVPSVAVATSRALREVLQPSSEAALLITLEASGGFAAGFVIAFSETHARALAHLLLGGGSPDDAAALLDSALTETGNVLAGAYLNAMASVTGWSIPLSTPALLRLEREALPDCLDWSDGSFALCLETTLTVDGSGPLRGYVLLFPRSGTLPGLLEAIGLGQSWSSKWSGVKS